MTQTVQENLEGQTNEKACSYLLERVDYIIDAASNASPNFFKLKPVEVMKANINGVSHLMEYGLEHGMRRMVYVSSGEIYGEGDGSEFTEMSSGYVDCASVRACYPSSKRAAETLCMSYVEEYHADVVIARLSHTYGPGFTESDNRVFAQFIRNVLRGEDIVLKVRVRHSAPGSMLWMLLMLFASSDGWRERKCLQCGTLGVQYLHSSIGRVDCWKGAS